MLTLDIPALAKFRFEPLAYGTALGQALFVDEIRDTFIKALGEAGGSTVSFEFGDANCGRFVSRSNPGILPEHHLPHVSLQETIIIQQMRGKDQPPQEEVDQEQHRQ